MQRGILRLIVRDCRAYCNVEGIDRGGEDEVFGECAVGGQRLVLGDDPDLDQEGIVLSLSIRVHSRAKADLPTRPKQPTFQIPSQSHHIASQHAYSKYSTPH